MTEEERQEAIKERQELLHSAEKDMVSVGLPIGNHLDTIKICIELEKDAALADAQKKSDALPDGFRKGKILPMPVGDSFAYYEIVKVKRHTVDLQWRNDLQVEPDYNDNILQAGGIFRKKDLKGIVAFIDLHRKIRNK